MNEPKEGEIRKGIRKGKDRNSYIWRICVVCGKARWQQINQQSERCKPCTLKGRFGPKSNGWKGGKFKGEYTFVYIPRGSKYFSMARQGKHTQYTTEHRLVMAKHLQRPLKSNEIVHHINSNKFDNRLENLVLTTNGKHKTTYKFGYKEGFDQGYTDGLIKGLKQISLSK